MANSNETNIITLLLTMAILVLFTAWIGMLALSAFGVSVSYMGALVTMVALRAAKVTVFGA